MLCCALCDLVTSHRVERSTNRPADSLIPAIGASLPIRHLLVHTRMQYMHGIILQAMLQYAAVQHLLILGPNYNGFP